MPSDDEPWATRSSLRDLARGATALSCLLGLVAFVLVSQTLLGGHRRGAAAATAQSRGIEVVGQLGAPSGVSRAVAVNDSYAYVGKGPRLVVYDISDPARPTRIGLGPILPGIVQHLVVTGEYVIVATSDRSVAVLRVSDPNRPYVVASLEVEYGASGIAVEADSAYITNGELLLVYNFADPTNPVRVAQLSLEGSPHGVAVHGGIAYVAAWDALRVVDVTDPAAPREIASLTVEGDPFEEFLYVAARDGLAILLGRDAHVVDVSDPHQPVKIGQFHPFQYPQDVELRAGLVFLAISTFDYDSFAPYGGFEVFDVSVPTDPVGRGQITLPDDGYAVAVGDGHTYLAADGEGLRVIDVSDADQLREVASDAPPFRAANSIASMGRYAFVSDGGQILAFDADALDRGDPLGGISVGHRRLFDPLVAADGYVYAGAEERFVVIDARDPGNMRQVARVSLEDELPGLQVVGQHLYLANKETFRVFDVSDPETPTEVATLPVPEWAQDLAIVDDTAYVSTYVIDVDGSRQGLVVIDLRNPENPRRLGWLALNGPLGLSFFETDVSAADGFVYVGGSLVIDARDPIRPHRAYQLTRAGKRVDSAIRGNRLYVAARGLPSEAPCLRVLDISDPARPHQTAALPLPDVGWGDHLATGADLVYVAAGDGGAYVVRDTGSPDDSSPMSRCAAQQPWEPLRVFLPITVRGR